MKIEQARSEKVSNKAKSLVEEFMSAEQVVNFGYWHKTMSENERKNERQKLENVKQEINHVIAQLGNKGFSVFFWELEKREQEANKKYDSDVREYCREGRADPNLADFYDNEVNASSRGLRKVLDSIGSVRTFLQQIQISQITPQTSSL
jgi:hypothetical protein